MTIEVTENGENSFTISWDENSPTESIFNDWTEEDFIRAISEYLETLQEGWGDANIKTYSTKDNYKL